MALLKKMSMFVLLFVVCGCMNQPISLEDRARIKKIAVVSLMGDDLFGLHAGLSPFNTSEQYWEVKDWDLDRFVEETVTTALSAKGRYDFVQFDLEKTNIKNLYGSTRNFDIKTNSIRDVLPKLQGVAAGSNVDAFIFVKRDGTKLSSQGPMYLIAYGSSLVCRSVLDKPIYVRIYLPFSISVVDAKTMKVVTERFFPIFYEEMGKDFCKDDLSNLTPTELQQIEFRIKRMLKDSIPERLEKLGL
jgi:hypothetical protein